MCKFYQGAEDKDLEKRLKSMFAKVFREKPESSRKVSSLRGGDVQVGVRCGILIGLIGESRGILCRITEEGQRNS